MKQRIIGILKIVLPVLLGVYICWHFWTSFDEDDKDAFFQVFKEANYGILSVSLLIGFISHLSRAYRWKYVLEPLGYKPSLLNTYNAVMIGYIANIVAPRMGEASRAGVLNGTDKVPFDKGFGTIVAERVVDLVCLMIVAGVAILINLDNMEDLIGLSDKIDSGGDDGTPWLKYLLIGGSALGFLTVAVLYFVSAKFKSKLHEFIAGIFEGLKAVLKMEKRWAYIGHTLLIWTCYLCMFWITFYAWDEAAKMPTDGILSGFIAGTVGFIIVQGGIGTYPLMVGTVLTFFLTPEILAETGKASAEHVGFGMLVWATQTVLIVFLGLVSLGMVQTKKKAAQAEA